MKITVTEALRLKNEIAGIVNTLNYASNTAQFGAVKEDEIVVSEDKDSFTQVFGRFNKALAYSAEINNTLANFNRETSIDAKVREMHNEKLRFQILSSALPKTKPSSTTRFENLGNGQRKAIKVTYTPTINSNEVKKLMGDAKKNMRSLQTEIEKLNQKEINLSFEHTDIESLVE